MKRQPFALPYAGIHQEADLSGNYASAAPVEPAVGDYIADALGGLGIPREQALKLGSAFGLFPEGFRESGRALAAPFFEPTAGNIAGAGVEAALMGFPTVKGAAKAAKPYVTKPPVNVADYIDGRAYSEALHSPYFKDGAKIASSREVPYSGELPPVGSWRMDSLKGNYGQDIYELRKMKIDDLHFKELQEGKLDPLKRGDDERYAAWLAEGRRAPPIEVMQRDDGSFVVADGHRRALAAKLAGQDEVEAWVSYAAPTGKVGHNDVPIMTSLTYDLAHKTDDAASTPGIRAYHGSPHDFDRFSLDKIGTGEGAQAYGHGLYFADNEDVAKSYRDAMTGKGLKIGAPAPDFPWSDEISAFAYRAASDDNVDAATAATRAAWQFPELRGRDLKPLEDTITKAKDAYKGRMYEVNINADPETFLDWDKPLAEQNVPPELVSEFRARQSDGYIPEHMRGDTGASLLGYLRTNAYEGGAANSHADEAVQAARRLRDAGIPGIRYLDQGSRGAGEGSSNYVVFDDKLIEILRKYGIALPFGLGAAGAGALGKGPDEPETY
jgi:hypothetical protein